MMLVDTGGFYLKITEGSSPYSLSIFFNLMISLRFSETFGYFRVGQVLSDHDPDCRMEPGANLTCLEKAAQAVHCVGLK